MGFHLLFQASLTTERSSYSLLRILVVQVQVKIHTSCIIYSIYKISSIIDKMASEISGQILQPQVLLPAGSCFAPWIVWYMLQSE